MSIREILSVLRQHIVLVLVIALSFALIGAWVSSREPTTYTATALVLMPDPSAPLGGPLSAPTVRDRDILTSIESFSTFPIEEDDLALAGVELTTDQARAAITLSPMPGTNIVKVAVSGSSAEDVEALAAVAAARLSESLNAERTAAYGELADRLRERINALAAEGQGSESGQNSVQYLGLTRAVLSEELVDAERQAAASQSAHRVISVSKAVASSSDPARGGLFGLAAGLLVGCAVAYWWYAAGDSLPIRSDRTDLDAPVLATVRIDCSETAEAIVGSQASAAMALAAERLVATASGDRRTLVLASLKDPACADGLSRALARIAREQGVSLGVVLGSRGADSSSSPTSSSPDGANTVVAKLPSESGARAVDALRESAATLEADNDAVLVASPWLAQADETALLGSSGRQVVLLAEQSTTRARINACIDNLEHDGVGVAGVISLRAPKRRTSSRS